MALIFVTQNALESRDFDPCQLLLYTSALAKLSVQVGRAFVSLGHASLEEE